jgi:hypothetical protein
MTTPTIPEIESLSLRITKEIRVKAPIDVTFAALLEQNGPSNEKPDGSPMPFKIEAWPGGRWFRDLGDGNGHCWGIVQAIKRPTLLEISGPLFASYPFVSNVQYRLTEAEGVTTIAFRHTALGFIQDQVQDNMEKGWATIHEQVRKTAEAR